MKNENNFYEEENVSSIAFLKTVKFSQLYNFSLFYFILFLQLIIKKVI